METVNYKGYEIELERQTDITNHGTNGGVRFFAFGKMTNKAGKIVDVKVYWDTTDQYDTNSARHKELVNKQYDDGLDDNESDELYHLECFFDDDSKACDWDNPSEVFLWDGSSFDLVESDDIDLTKD